MHRTSWCESIYNQSHFAAFDETQTCEVNKYWQMLISLRGVRDDEILGGRQLVTESGLSTVIAPNDNWWAVFRCHDTNTVSFALRPSFLLPD